MNGRITIGGTVFGVALAASTVAHGAAFDTVCERVYSAEVCACSKNLMVSRLGMKEFAFYAVAVKAAMKNEEAGMSPEDAWAAAGQANDESAQILAPDMKGRSDELRAAHLKALDECGG